MAFTCPLQHIVLFLFAEQKKSVRVFNLTESPPDVNKLDASKVCPGKLSSPVPADRMGPAYLLHIPQCWPHCRGDRDMNAGECCS